MKKNKTYMDKLMKDKEFRKRFDEEYSKKLKKVDYVIEKIYYWDCPKCNYHNCTNTFVVFPKCYKCNKKFIWGVNKDTSKGRRKDKDEDWDRMDYIEKGATISILKLILIIIIILTYAGCIVYWGG